jgi:hypothetical protein
MASMLGKMNPSEVKQLAEYKIHDNGKHAWEDESFRSQTNTNGAIVFHRLWGGAMADQSIQHKAPTIP